MCTWLLVRLARGKNETEGFTYLPDFDFSIQGAEANACWENSLRLAQKIGTPISVTFEWHNKPEAARPGETSSLAWVPGEE